MKPRYDCLKCPGYCCSYGRIVVTERDIARLARYFDIPVEKARHRFAYRYRTKDVDEWILRHRKDHVFRSVCRFLDPETRRCTVYEARPAVCREYPDGIRCGYFEFLMFEREHQDDPDLVIDAR
ncbi:MAG: YkgJ family cysteine cluster protein [Pseudomonadota bacterium]|jgi:Predicted Fe-S-cluster oxidoreductase|nr:MAG: YkgJ family cysteine cluster protein [Pseudomonadota bacterium]